MRLAQGPYFTKTRPAMTLPDVREAQRYIYGMTHAFFLNGLISLSGGRGEIRESNRPPIVSESKLRTKTTTYTGHTNSPVKSRPPVATADPRGTTSQPGFAPFPTRPRTPRKRRHQPALARARARKGRRGNVRRRRRATRGCLSGARGLRGNENIIAVLYLLTATYTYRCDCDGMHRDRG
jgi:hypothetical protein